MFKQSPSRNQRSKSFKIKHVLQICMLLAVCFWLLYQIKHSHDKKKEFDENGAKLSVNTENGVEILKFGRKDLHPRVQETTTNNDKHEEEEVEEEETGGGEEEENKHEEEEQEEESKTEEREDEGRGGGDDELDELDQEKTEGEIDREEDFLDDEKEKEDDEGDEKEREDKEGKTENESSLEDQDHDGSGRNTHEAREENYKGDDASSAVTHDTAETEKLSLENSNENENVNIVELANKSNTTEEINSDQSSSVLKEGEGEMAEDGNSLNVTANEENDNEIDSSKSGNSSLLNLTITTESNDQVEANNNSTEVSRETPLAVQNGTVIKPDSTQAENAMVDDPTAGKGSNLQTIVLEQINTSNTVSDGNQSDSNYTISTTEDTKAITRESTNSSVSEHDISEKIIISNPTAEEDSSSNSLTADNDDATRNKNSDPSKGMGTTEEGSDSSSTNENADAVHQDPNDSSDTTIPQEEKEARTDLDTLPEIRTEGSNTEDAAAE